MMHDSELADPYIIPKTLPARRPFKYLAYGIIVGVVLLSASAGAMMVWWSISPSPFGLDRGPAIDKRGQLIDQRRGPSIPPPASVPETAAP